MSRNAWSSPSAMSGGNVNSGSGLFPFARDFGLRFEVVGGFAARGAVKLASNSSREISFSL
jgi:hypothetical protein